MTDYIEKLHIQQAIKGFIVLTAFLLFVIAGMGIYMVYFMQPIPKANTITIEEDGDISMPIDTVATPTDAKAVVTDTIP